MKTSQIYWLYTKSKKILHFINEYWPIAGLVLAILGIIYLTQIL